MAALVGLWLVSVLVFVLPARDPESVVAWSIVAIVALASVMVAVAFLVRPAAAIRLGLGLVGAVELMTGVVLVGAWVSTPADTSGEAYILLVGVALALHAGAAIDASLRSG